MEVVITVKDKDYLPPQQMLVDIWKEHLKHVGDGLNLGFLTFTKQRPKNPKSDTRKIAGIKAECVSYLKDDRELVKMSEQNFILLMAKMGIDMDIQKLDA